VDRVSKRSATSGDNDDGNGKPRAKRLKADERKELILEAARRAFSRRGDVAGTTIKDIAAEAGISEGIIYRHFESKDELFYQAAVEPLNDAINHGVEKIKAVNLDLAGVDRHGLAMAYYQEMISTLADLVPLLGLVLFGDPQYADPFYRDVLTPAMADVLETWNEAFRRLTGEDFPSKYGALANFGIALIYALDQRRSADPEPIETVARALADYETRRIWAALDTVEPRRKALRGTTKAGRTTGAGRRG
jgi:AcrR family transcriptional regulator